jgi:hypothetical protein
MKILPIFVSAMVALSPIPANAVVRAKHAFSRYIHPQRVIALQEEQGNANTSYRWRGVYTVDLRDPQIAAELKEVNNPEYSPGMAGVTLYEHQVRAAGYQVHSRMSGIFMYDIQDGKGTTWAVIVRGDRDFHSANSSEFTVVIGVPGG